MSTNTSVFENINLSPVRQPDEPFEQYKVRLALNDKILRWYKKGQLIYSPTEKIKIPKTDMNRNILKDENGNIIYHEKEMLIGPYSTKLFGPLSEFGRKRKPKMEITEEKPNTNTNEGNS